MNLRVLCLVPFLFSVALADEDDFPGLKQVMTASEWAHSGLDQLNPDQIAIIDSALTRHYAHTVDKAAEASTARALVAAQARAAAVASDSRSDAWLSRFGMASDKVSWEDRPALKAKVVDWVRYNAFRLDNGQVWEGFDYIPYELKGHPVEIQPRPMGMFELIVDGKETTVRVHRIQ